MKTLLFTIVTSTLASTAYAARIDVSRGTDHLQELSSAGVMTTQTLAPGPGFGEAISRSARDKGREFGSDVSRAARNKSAAPPPVAAVPLPAAAWLFGSAMLGLAVVGRKKT
jgi:hypothetical protein